jgi:hypothetical protein
MESRNNLKDLFPNKISIEVPQVLSNLELVDSTTTLSNQEPFFVLVLAE